VTLGCFGFVLSFVINGIAVYYLSLQLPAIFHVNSLWYGIALVVLMSVFNGLLNMVLPRRKRRTRQGEIIDE
jgi:uncharacterized membrane protein YvlD (DUF360 family)